MRMLTTLVATPGFLQDQRHSVRLVERIGGGDQLRCTVDSRVRERADLEATLPFAVAASGLSAAFWGRLGGQEEYLS